MCHLIFRKLAGLSTVFESADADCALLDARACIQQIISETLQHLRSLQGHAEFVAFCKEIGRLGETLPKVQSLRRRFRSPLHMAEQLYQRKFIH